CRSCFKSFSCTYKKQGGGFFSRYTGSHGNSAAAFTLDGKTGPHDAHRCWEHGSRIFAQSTRQQGVLAQHPAGTRPRRPPSSKSPAPSANSHFLFSNASTNAMAAT